MNLENLDSVIDFITENDLIESGDVVGVGVSGGSDSMALLHFLHTAAAELGVTLVAVNVNHNMRPGSRKDSAFVKSYCKDNNIAYAGYSVDVPTFAATGKLSPEVAARIKRYECFEAAIKKFKITKFALAHHQSDQAETILLHIFRGSGLAGARGMDAVRGVYIRPFLETAKTDITAYIYKNQIPYVEDESNADNSYARNFLRNEIIPMLQREWRGVERNIIGFGQTCRSDDEYIAGQVGESGLLKGENNVRIALNYFAYAPSIASRIVLSAFDVLGTRENIEKKHIDIIMMLAITGENGSRADLPNGLTAVKEYEYITLIKKSAGAASHKTTAAFKMGKTTFTGFGTITVTKTISFKPARERGLMVIDADKLPRAARWRTRREGDAFTKFGGGTKPLAAYLIDRKIPVRLRDRIPVLAAGSEIFAIAGVEISDKVKTDKDTLEAYVLEFAKD
jgi:tRNA(Ile)-lysidine synthase